MNQITANVMHVSYRINFNLKKKKFTTKSISKIISVFCIIEYGNSLCEAAFGRLVESLKRLPI